MKLLFSYEANEFSEVSYHIFLYLLPCTVFDVYTVIITSDVLRLCVLWVRMYDFRQ